MFSETIKKKKNYNNFVLFLLVLALIGVVLSTNSAQAQGKNLLANPSFEGAFSHYTPNPPISDCPHGPCTTAQMAPGWFPWWVSQLDSDKDTDRSWVNRMPEYKKAEAPFLNRVHSGDSAQQYFTFWASHTAGIYQRVKVPKGVRLRFTIYGQAWSTHDDEPTSNSPTAVNMKIGIDTQGGFSFASPNIVWSGSQNPYDGYAKFVVEATSQSDFVTVFTYARQDEPRKHNDMYWDSAELIVVGAPANQGPTPNWEATKQAEQNPQAPQTAQTQPGQNPPSQAVVSAAPVTFVVGATPTPNAEGVILMEVPPGGSIWSVAANAGISLDEILSLNNLTQDSFVRVGQPLIVGYGPANGAVAAEAVPAEVEAPVAAEAQPQAIAQIPATAVIPTPQPIPSPQAAPAIAVADSESGGTAICLKAFDDDNHNGIHDAGESLRSNVAFTISNGQQVTSNYVTTGTNEPYCLDGLGEGNYQITRSQAETEVLTTRGDWGVALTEGSAVTLDFGSYTDETLIAANNVANNINAAPELNPAGGGGLNNVFTIVAVLLAVLFLVGVVTLVLSARRS